MSASGRDVSPLDNAAVIVGRADSTVGFYGNPGDVKPAALTAADARAFTAADAAVVDALYGAEEAGVITNLRTRLAENEAVTANLRTRLGELETRLRTLGVLP